MCKANIASSGNLNDVRKVWTVLTAVSVCSCMTELYLLGSWNVKPRQNCIMYTPQFCNISASDVIDELRRHAQSAAESYKGIVMSR